jgi:hypothetical protein
MKPYAERSQIIVASMIVASGVADFSAEAVVGIKISVRSFVTWIGTFSDFSLIPVRSVVTWIGTFSDFTLILVEIPAWSSLIIASGFSFVQAIKFVSLLFVGTSVENYASAILPNVFDWISLIAIVAVLAVLNYYALIITDFTTKLDYDVPPPAIA